MSNQVKINSYKDLIVWQKAMDLVVMVYELTDKFPREEKYGLISQMRRSSVSIPSNIAEGTCRGTRKDYRQFILIAFGSCSELETQIEVSKRLENTKNLNYEEIGKLLIEVSKMLNAIIIKLEQ